MDLSGRPADVGRPLPLFGPKHQGCDWTLSHRPPNLTAMADPKRIRPRWSIGLVAVLALWLPSAVAAQSYRGWTSTSVQVVELLPLGVDTVPRSEVVTDANGRFLYDDLEVSCVLADVCTGYLPLGKERTFAATQDLSLTAWGFGVEGLSVTTLLRGRAHAGGGIVWPRADDRFDAQLLYAQLQRRALRLRLGRQDVRSGLGFSGYDGLSASYSLRSIAGEVYGGRSLARGLREPQDEALRGLDDFFVDKGVYLIGGSVSGQVLRTLVTARYQREILSDRSGLVSDRTSLDFSTTLPRVRVYGSADYDFSFKQVGKGHLTVSAPLFEGHWLLELTGRRYVPYFDLSTIWGFFEPVSYSEIVSRVGWSPRRDLTAWLSGGWRTYGDTKTTAILEPMRDTGWRADAGARWVASPSWTLDGHYQLEWGPGGFLSSADAAVRYAVSESLTAALSALTFQQIEEYRLGQGRAFGVRASGDYQLNGRMSFAGGFSLIRHRDGGNVFTSPWTQSRGWTSLRVDIGEDPGLANRRRQR